MAEGFESKIDFELFAKSLEDGTADEYLERVGSLPAEALLEEQGDERTWPELSEEEKTKIAALLWDYAYERDLHFEFGCDSCMVIGK